MDLNRWLDGVSLIACVGSGGVGKTTTAATLGLYAAARGRKVIVLTIDPAKRLANSLGLQGMSGEPTRIDLARLPEIGVQPAEGGELWAMMLDSRGTFDALISAVSPTPEARDRILGNHVYRAMADALAGSQDYMATEKLYDLVRDGRWDLVVLDTPPVKNALDFLEAPGRVVAFLDERVLSWFLAPIRSRKSGGGWASWLLSGATGGLYKLLGYVFGQEFLDDFGEFLDDFNGLYEGFRQRHTAVLALLRDPRTTFVIVTAPTEASVDVARFFEVELRRRELPLAGRIINQVHVIGEAGPGDAAALEAQAAAQAGDLPTQTAPRLVAHLQAALAELRARVASERAVLAELQTEARGGFWKEVPRFAQDVHDLPALWAVARAIFEGPPSRP
jgi:anion-transporting  ArsA/GET3 family ATPase